MMDDFQEKEHEITPKNLEPNDPKNDKNVS
jgi:hypothetical protein